MEYVCLFLSVYWLSISSFQVNRVCALDWSKAGNTGGDVYFSSSFLQHPSVLDIVVFDKLSLVNIDG